MSVPQNPHAATPPPRPASEDTSAEADRILFEGYARMSDRERLRRVGELGRFVEELALGEIRARHPAASERELRLRLAARRFDRATMIAAFGWDPAAHGA